MSGSFNALGCHIYAGGFSIGVRDAGFNLLGHLEEWTFGTATAMENLKIPVWRSWEEPIKEFAGKVDLLYGNPPCASWSSAGVLKGVAEADRWKQHGLTDCTHRLFGLVPALNPKIFVWECVSQVVTQGANFLADRTAEVMEQGYHVYHVILDARETGLPQRRKRFFFVASKVEVNLTPPNSTPVTVREALKNIKDPGPGMPLTPILKEILDSMPVNVEGSLRRQFDKLYPGHTGPGRPGFLNKRAALDAPACTITGGPEFYHPSEPRRFTVLEQQVLCGYPPDYKFIGTMGMQYKQVGKGVTPPAARWLASQLFQALQNATSVTSGMTVYNFTGKGPAVSADRHTKTDERGPKPIDTGGGPRAQTIKPKRGDNHEAPGTPPVLTTKAPRGLGIGAYIRGRLADGADPDTILEEVHEKFPTSKATKGDIAWNKRKMVLDGAPQPIRNPDKPREEREYDKTQLRENGAGAVVHRDYAAHFFRWGFIRRFIEERHTTLLDVGCGQDKPLSRLLSLRIQTIPKIYVGVDLNKLPDKGNYSWARYHDEFNFVERYYELVQRYSQFNLVVCLEVLEHMPKSNGIEMLKALRETTTPDGTLVLSTPVFNGKAARNHIHEWGIEELDEELKKAKWVVDKRYGTFASYNDIKKVMSEPEKVVYNTLREFYDGDVMACFLAPLHPDQARNNVWVCRLEA